MTSAFEQTFDEAAPHTQSKRPTPRQKKGAAGRMAESIHVPPLPTNSNPPKKAAKKKAKFPAEPNGHAPSSSTIPRKRGRLAQKSTETSIDEPGVNNSDGHPRCDSQRAIAIGQGRVGQHALELQRSRADAAISHIVAGWKMRQRWHRAEKALILQAKAICRAFADGDKDKANVAFEATLKGAPPSEEISMALFPFIPAIERFETERKAIEKSLKKTARELPGYEWAMSVRGFGELNFVAIVGECCVMEEDGSMRGIGDYKTVSALWKRMGLALVNGERQRKVADAELAILHGYNPSRRSVAFNLGECLIKAGSEFKEIYNERKAYELARDETIKPILAHRRAARYMTKRVLRKLYAQWRKETRGESGDPDEITLPLAAE